MIISNERLHFCMRQIGELLRRGDSMAEAIAKLQQATDTTYISEISAINLLVQRGEVPTIKVERSGLLAASNKVVGIVRKQQGDIRAAFIGLYDLFLRNPRRFNTLIAGSAGLMVYLLTVLIFAVIMASIYIIFVLPQFDNLFQNSGAELPIFTKLVFSFARGYGSVTLLLLLLLILAPIICLQTMRGSMRRLEFIHGFLLHLPLIGRAAMEYNNYLALCLLRIFNLAGISDQNALHILGADYTKNISRRNNAEYVSSSLMVSMKLGTYAYELQQQLEFKDSCGETPLNSFKDIVSIVGIVLVACVVGCLVFAMYLPIFQSGKIVG